MCAFERLESNEFVQKYACFAQQLHRVLVSRTRYYVTLSTPEGTEEDTRADEYASGRAVEPTHALSPAQPRGELGSARCIHKHPARLDDDERRQKKGGLRNDRLFAVEKLREEGDAEQDGLGFESDTSTPIRNRAQPLTASGRPSVVIPASAARQVLMPR